MATSETNMFFIFNQPAAVVSDCLIVAELHLGLEFELRRKNHVFVPLQHKKIARQLNALLKQTNAKRLIVLGDLKHDVSGFEREEQKMLSEFIDALECEQLILVKGNHDSLIEKKLFNPKLKIVPATGMVLEEEGKKIGLAHGHAWPSHEVLEADVLLLGHQHPGVKIIEKTGMHMQPVWLVGEIKASKKFGTRKQQAIVFPAFGSLTGYMAVNEGKRMLGPFFENKLFDLANAKAIALNGLLLGRMKDLTRFAKKKTGRKRAHQTPKGL